ncbi:hypothetical protein M2451_000826 [Dysgonomonas sp. PFB1-18]|uniref:hypothetical protein n=2 Tax=unclassified Dysgonomonas TaxID=2630389 RepID=UPI002474821A|nr:MULTISPECIES: hypothetical protein [unclassified Dysgonomonas]MDH6308515.1 hypothetical protein [Dysgonomonas sp. PF1-14]MDH6338016.1 hypothetical protein [Dysgonomonas sp. PF1-16]MDH6379513.1 hypothetical protein [Dysgonomonas sp. PFB1-18]MDH6396843.1 hypothetical protein [Dysgonomonas sp. PF1-23]
MHRFIIIIISLVITLIAFSQNTEYADSLKREFLLKLMDERGDTTKVLINNLPDIEYNYFVKKVSLNGRYCLELKAVTHVDSIAKAKYGSLIEDRDVFSGYSYSQKIEILEELLSFQGDTTKSGKSYKINSPDLSRIYIEPFNIQIEALYTFSKMLLIGYPPILPKLTDKNEVINLNGNQTVVDEVYELYRQWLQNAIKNDFKNITLPMSGSYYQWEGQGKITSKWFIDFHKKEKNDLSYNAFEESCDYINTMLKDEIPLYFKNAVLNTEVAFNDEKFDIEKVNQKYRLLVHLAKEFSKGNLISYIGKDKDIITKHAAIFKVKYLQIRH